MIRKNRMLITLVVICTELIMYANSHAQPIHFSEYAVKASFLYNFAKFVEWPEKAFAAPDSPVLLYILGEIPFKDALSAIEDSSAGGRKIVIRYCQNITETKGCHILFISLSEKKKFSDVLENMKNTPCLTVSDIEEFTKKGGMIRLFREDNRISFEINLKAAELSDLVISARLLKLAKIYKPE